MIYNCQKCEYLTLKPSRFFSYYCEKFGYFVITKNFYKGQNQSPLTISVPLDRCSNHKNYVNYKKVKRKLKKL